MGHWRDIFKTDTERTRHRLHMEQHRYDQVSSTLPSKEVTKVALRLKYQVEQVIPCELEESDIVSPNSRAITKNVVQTARLAGGDDLQACVPFCLLVCLRWFKLQAEEELWDSDLHERRALACEVIAKRM
ncbi:hypothetical protein AbraIFM66950_001223 [Aspergillus brasiliensis]|nr:hypothetical protein AbraIFM66950_001223 [Aspergillus brasiliensis]